MSNYICIPLGWLKWRQDSIQHVKPRIHDSENVHPLVFASQPRVKNVGTSHRKKQKRHSPMPEYCSIKRHNTKLTPWQWFRARHVCRYIQSTRIVPWRSVVCLQLSASRVCRILVSGFCVTVLYFQPRVALLILIWLIWGPVSRMATGFLLWKIALIFLPMSDPDLPWLDRSSFGHTFHD